MLGPNGAGKSTATTLSKPAYGVGKFLSHFAILTSIVLVLAVAAVVMLLLHREDPRFGLWALLSPFLLIALPAMAVTAALALLFEMLPGGTASPLYTVAYLAIAAILLFSAFMTRAAQLHRA